MIAYFLSNIAAKNYQKRLICVEVIVVLDTVGLPGIEVRSVERGICPIAVILEFYF